MDSWGLVIILVFNHSLHTVTLAFSNGSVILPFSRLYYFLLLADKQF